MTKSVEKANRSTEPTLIEIGNALRALEGEPAKRTRELMNTIFELAGSKQIDWSDPDRWIEVELTGELQRLARKVWQASGRTINPRFLYSHLVVINRLALLQPVDGIYRIGERGNRFLAGDESILRELVALRSSKRRPIRNFTNPGIDPAR